MSQMSDMVAGAYYASTVLFGLGGLVFALATRDRLYAYFALHALAVGTLALTFPPISPAADAVEPWHIGCRIAAEGMVVATIGLGLRQLLAPHLPDWLQWGIWAVFPVGLIAAASSIWFVFNSDATALYDFTMLTVLVTVFIAFGVGIRRGHRHVIWTAVALTPMLTVGMIAATMESFALGSMQNYPESILIGFAFELVFVSGMLAVRFNRVITERNCAEAQAKAARIASEIDPLTGIANRRTFDDELEHRPHERFAALAIIDCDHFKLINDRFGHAAGDTVLQAIAGCLAHVPGRAMRIGGEEFALFLTGANWRRELETLREAIRCLPGKAITGSLIAPAVTVSIGAVKLRHDLPAEEALMFADEALYRAKHRGRNRLEVHQTHREAAPIDHGIACAA